MKISLNWLKDFVSIPSSVTPQRLAEDLSLHTVEVEDVIYQAEQYENVVVGKIKKINHHPNADKLKICSVAVGPFKNLKIEVRNYKQHQNLILQIVCGGQNIYEGMKVAVALPGAKIKWHGQGEPVELEEAKIRGVVSEGMICSSAEIGLVESVDKQPEGRERVVDLKDIKAKIGTPLAQALGLNDVIFDIDNKSITHRADLWGHQGIAREIAAIYGRRLKSSKAKIQKLTPYLDSNVQSGRLTIKVKDTEHCLRYLAVQIDNIQVSESPGWLKKRLLAVGQRPINNIVDITNYVMYELGQPVHAFDAGRLKAGNLNSKLETRARNKKHTTLIIRLAKEQEVIRTLDGQKRKLDSRMLVIADEEKAIAIAGVMGGSNSEVDERTKSIIIESANFNPISVRRTAQKLGLRTEASARFEKGLDPHLAERAIRRVVELINLINPEAQVASNLVEQGRWKYKPRSLQVGVDFISQRLGIKLSEREAGEILGRLGFKVKAQNLKLTVEIPSWRGDVSIPADIVEEVGRLRGYNKIELDFPLFSLKPAVKISLASLERKIKNFLTLNGGCQEVENYIFTSQSLPAISVATTQKIKVANPASQDQEYLRTELLPQLLINVKNNLRFFSEVKLFEMGRVFNNMKGNFTIKHKAKEFLPRQPKQLAGVISREKALMSDLFYEVKGLITSLLDYLGFSYDLKEANLAGAEPSYYLAIKLSSQQEYLGGFGLIKSKLLAQLKIKAAVAFFYLDYEKLLEWQPAAKVYCPLPAFPGVKRDIAVVVDQQIKYHQVEQTIRQTTPFLAEMRLFDVYTGPQIGQGKRSLAFSLIFRSPDKTLTAKEADEELRKITSKLKEKFHAYLR